jgi:hypothetical protein
VDTYREQERLDSEQERLDSEQARLRELRVHRVQVVLDKE